MALDLRANTAVDVLIGPFVDDSDGNTDETGLTITQADIRLSKNGQNMAQKNDANACTHDELGMYNCPLDATDTNTEGSLVLVVHESGALPVRHEFNIMAEAAWDSLYVAKDTGYMDVNVKTYNEQTATTSVGNLPDVNVNEIEDGDATDAINAACDTAIETYNLDHLMLTGGTLTDFVADNTALAHLMATGGDISDFSNTTDALESIRDKLTDIETDTAEIGAAGVGLTEAGGDGDHLTEAGGDGDHLTEAGGTGDQYTAIPWNASWDAEVQSECADALTVYDPPTKAEMDTAHALLATVAKQDVIDGIVDDILVDTGTTLDTIVDSILSLLDDARGEPAQGAPPVNPDMATKVDWLYKFLRNKVTTTSSQISVYDDAGTTVDHKSTISDDGTTFTRGEFATGP